MNHKKISAIISAAALVFSLTACSNNSSDLGKVEPVNPETTVTEPDSTSSENSSEATGENTEASEETKPPKKDDKPSSKSEIVLPGHVLTGYWHNFDNGAKCLKIKDVPASYDIIAVSFAEATTNAGELTFALDPDLCNKLGGYSKEDFIKEIKNAPAKGQYVILSVGGERGAVRVDSEEAAERFADSAFRIMKEYGFHGIDIDLENGLNPQYMEMALRKLHDKMGEMIITMAPQTIDMQNPENGYFKLALNIKDILTIVNMQYYNSGSMIGQNGNVYSQGTVEFLTALAAIQLENGLRPDQVGLGLPSCGQAAGGGYVEPSVVVDALECLATGKKSGGYIPPKKYPTIRGAMTWSINWDASNNYQFANRVAVGLLDLPEAPDTSLSISEFPKEEETTTATVTTAPKQTASDEWKLNGNYNQGDVVSFGGKRYRCLQPHTALQGWEPDKTGALWEPIA